MMYRSVWVALLVAVLSVAWAWSWARSAAPSGERSRERQMLSVPYTIEQSVWGATRPTLCQVAQALELGSEARAATMAENDACGPGVNFSRRLSSSEVVRIVVWAPPGEDPVRQCAQVCDAREAVHR